MPDSWDWNETRDSQGRVMAAGRNSGAFSAQEAAKMADDANVPAMDKIWDAIREKAQKGEYRVYFGANFWNHRKIVLDKITTELRARGFKVEYYQGTGQRDESSLTVIWDPR
jgi:hypothetical protein